MDLSEGPERNLHSQLGFVRREEHDPCTFPGHKAASSKRDPVDGRLFVNVIGWFATMVCAVL
jgi:hypothetical protein